MRSIPIDVLRAFVAVVEARGFTRAAEDLGRSQPTISLQVKRLEELVEAPLFERATRFELTGVGAVCFDYGKRLLRLHDDMLDEAARRRTPDHTLRVGMASEFAAVLAPRLAELRADDQVAAAFDVITKASQALAADFQQNALDLALIVGASDGDPHRIEQWRARLLWFGGGGKAYAESQPLPLLVGPQGSPVHEATIGALRAHGRKFDIVCTSPDVSVLAAAALAGLGVAPMIDGLAPQGLKLCAGRGFPPLPEIALSLLARSPALAIAGRRWIASVVEKLQPA
jgi:DNA-binding transcriptional LysR family regulator